MTHHVIHGLLFIVTKPAFDGHRARLSLSYLLSASASVFPEELCQVCENNPVDATMSSGLSPQAQRL